MNVAAYKGASALAAYEQWQQSISQNLAYTGVVGYRRDQATFSGLMAEIANLNDGRKVTQSVKGVMPQCSANLDVTPSPMRNTGVQTDFAVDGPGFFRVTRANGTKAYSRSGEFRLNQDRVLVTQKGDVVDGENGPVQFQQQGGEIFINSTGMIVQGTQQIGRIGVFKFDDASKLRRAGDSMLVPSVGQNPIPVENASVLHMVLEESNVRPMKEAIDMVMVSRFYEASRKVIDASDENAGKAIQYLGSSS
jgi:flagellar basal body rod protein FlgG